MNISVVMPVYNEVKTIKEIVSRVNAVPIEKEIIIVDDFSSDGTKKELENIVKTYNNIKVIYHERNKGKGAALRTGFNHVVNDIVIIQDADLEYNPQEYLKLIEPIMKNKTHIVYGSRLLGNSKRIFSFWQYMGNRFLTVMCNAVYGLKLTDMATCYKIFSRGVLKEIIFRSNGFGFCPEFTAKVTKKGFAIYEVPIGYISRNRSDGKKITWKDALVHMAAILWFRLFD